MFAEKLHTLCEVIPTKWRKYRDHRVCDVISPSVYVTLVSPGSGRGRRLISLRTPNANEQVGYTLSKRRQQYVLIVGRRTKSWRMFQNYSITRIITMVLCTVQRLRLKYTGERD